MCYTFIFCMKKEFDSSFIFSKYQINKLPSLNMTLLQITIVIFSFPSPPKINKQIKNETDQIIAYIVQYLFFNIKNSIQGSTKVISLANNFTRKPYFESTNLALNGKSVQQNRSK